MRSIIFAGILAFAFLLPPGVPPASAILGIGEEELTEEQKQAKIKGERAEIRKMAKETLGRLYKVQPMARQKIPNAAGYAVFSNFGMKLGIVGSGRGEGLAVNNKTGKETFMKMLEVEGGLGYGAKSFSQIFVFEAEAPLRDFIENGWAFGSEAQADVKHEDTGQSIQEAITLAPGVYLYQLTDTGLSAEMTAKGTKYYKDDDLN